MRSRHWLFVSLVVVGCIGSSDGDRGASSGGDDGKSQGPGAGSGDGGALTPTKALCTAAPGASGRAAPVAAPTLEKTLPASWDENWLASPALADLDGDGELDIVAARHSVLYAWRADGTLLWQTAFSSSAGASPEHGDSRMWASPVVGDFDGDGDLEIAVGSYSGASHGKNVAVYDHTGKLLPGWPQRFGDKAAEVRAITAADLDGDGRAEIVVNKTASGPVTAAYRLDGTMAAGWPQVASSCNPPPPAEKCWDYGGYNQNIGAADFDGDGKADVVSTYDAIGFGLFGGDGHPFPTAPGFTDKVVTSVEAYHDPALSLQGWGTGDRSEFTYSPPVLADIDGDGDLEIVLGGDHEHSDSTENRGITVWVLNHDMTRPKGWETPKDTGMPLGGADLGDNIVPTQPSPAVADLDPAPGLEILVPAYDGKLHAFRADGTVLWTYAFATVATPYTGAAEPLIVDLNGDGVPEVLFTTFSSGAPRAPQTPAHLIVLSAGGQELHKIPLSGRGSMAAPAVADLDGDGELELVISLKDTVGGGQGGVQIWALPGARDNCVLWSTGRGGNLRQGYVAR